MKSTSIKRALMAAAFVTLLPAAALAQDDVAERANEIAEQAGELANEVSNTQEMEAVAADTTADGADVDAVDNNNDDDGFDWGILGLLGLAGLLGLKKNDRDVHVDTRRDNARL